MVFDDIFVICDDYSGLKNRPHDTDRQQEIKLVNEIASGCIMGELVFVSRTPILSFHFLSICHLNEALVNMHDNTLPTLTPQDEKCKAPLHTDLWTEVVQGLRPKWCYAITMPSAKPWRDSVWVLGSENKLYFSNITNNIGSDITTKTLLYIERIPSQILGGSLGVFQSNLLGQNTAWLTLQFDMPAGHQPPSEIPVPILSTNLQLMIFEKTPLIGLLPALFSKIDPELDITSTIWKAMCLFADLRNLDRETLLGCMKEGSGQEKFLKTLARYYTYPHSRGRGRPERKDILKMQVILSRRTHEDVPKLFEQQLTQNPGENWIQSV